ncbi:magnesium-translocating P-type ATPase [Sphingomonas glacialis]|uniref:Magnesium-transporting ATPase, P-type 1 n=1 Tax=Sphingomonas glacialis TaxID=658225 RepID=A0ABQ3LS45_9SPHN|nr:magnesium-translocating P-type ATPase [Sphingomonas glacialis]GHH24699.1 magnesium-translocating P-type ATPase [Sphingomonas glacialis]
MIQPVHAAEPIISAPTGNRGEPDHAPFWTRSIDDLRATLRCGDAGLSSAEAADRLGRYGLNADVVGKSASALRTILRRLLEPLSLILLAAALVSAGTGDLVGGSIIATILILSIGLDTVQEGHAIRAADVLRKSVALTAEVRRDGTYAQVPVGNVVPGDMIRVRVGDIVPADGLVIESDAFAANEAALTGEPYPVEKRPGPVTGLSASQASGAVFRGAVAQTGEAVVLVINTGAATIFGAAASALNQPTETSPFQADLRAYGLLVMRLTMALVLVVLATSVFFGRPLLQSLLFAVALAVGLTPELLPMITTVTLSRGAIRMARRKVIVKRLVSIHDLGAMTVLCTDKTGTLTSAHITLAQSIACSGTLDPRPSRLAAIAAILGGDRGALDAALVEGNPTATSGWTLLGRHAFDFNRRLGSIVAGGLEGDVLIAKGAPDAIIALCTASRNGGANSVMEDSGRAAVLARVKELAEKDGLRAIAVASRAWTEGRRDPGTADETGLVFEGLCAFADPPKPTAAAAVARLAAQGIRLKILSGDDPIVVRRLSGLVGLDARRVLSGADIEHLSDDALAIQVRSVHAYGRLAPDQKSRLVRALQAGGAVVGYLGDGINDAPALKAANIGLSVSGATGVAQAAADMILLDQDLAVVADGVEEGRRTFVNILKYIRMGMSSNFGNMLSMAAASLFLPFLPMLPTQILLNNLLYDISEIGIPFDSVRPEAIVRPQRWDMHALIRFAAVMGPLSSVFDLFTFGGLIFLFHASPPEFRTAWFLESMATQILVIFVIRTNGRPWADRPKPILVATSLGALLVAMALPFTPAAALFGFQTPPLAMTGGIILLVLFYLMFAESLKRAATTKILNGSRHRRAKARRQKGVST